MKPIVAVTTWKRTAPTFLGPATDLHTLPDFYAQSLDRAGAAMVLVAHLQPEDAGRVLEHMHGLVVTGGGDIDPALYGQEVTESERIEPTHDARDLALIREARRRRMPVLGICRGLQALNVAFGGVMTQHSLADDNTAHPTLSDDPLERNEYRHVVEFIAGCRMAAIYGASQRKVNSLHHQAVVAPGEGLEVVGRSHDGAIEAVESADPAWPVLAVQWHPEMMVEDRAEDALFTAFVDDARRYAGG